MNEATPKIARTAVLAACADMIRACGLTVQDLADFSGQSVTVPALARLTPAPDGGPPLSGNAEQILKMADTDDGVLAVEVRASLGCVQSNAQSLCQNLLDRGLLHRAKNAGSNAYRYFRFPTQAEAYCVQRGAPAPLPARFPDAAPAAPAVTSLTPAEIRSAEVHAARIAAAKKAPPPMCARTAHKPKPLPHQNVSFSQPKPPPDEARPKGEAITTDKTVETRDTTVRATAKWQLQDLPPDPRYPSFSSMPPGTDPRTGKAWEQRA